ncbi:MAG: histidine phosphatase family protein [Oscillospiraceae bacterium]|nr:histidine phosphatase family protein [Oscillospiraceae bacterium]
MRYICLIRHAEPLVSGKTRRCLGQRSDPPLSENGIHNAEALRDCLSGDFTVFTSPLLRAEQTAEIISDGRWKIKTMNELIELNMGEWDGLSFDVIKERYPELYEARRLDLSIPPKGGEAYESGAERGLGAIRKMLDSTTGNLIVVAHSALNKAILCTLMQRPMRDITMISQRHACVSVIGFDGKKLTVYAVGRCAHDVPNMQEINGLFKMCKTPDDVVIHSIAVRDAAIELAEAIGRTDTEALQAAALLHDMCRTEKNHAKAAADVLFKRGYFNLANIVAAHNDCPADGEIDDKKLLFLADKLVSGDKRVTIEERFSISRKKCADTEALAAHERRYIEALAVYDRYLELAKNNGGENEKTV